MYSIKNNIATILCSIETYTGKSLEHNILGIIKSGCAGCVDSESLGPIADPIAEMYREKFFGLNSELICCMLLINENLLVGNLPKHKHMV